MFTPTFTNEGKQRKKAPKGKSESPWSLHIRSFWKTHFINPPEVHGQVVRLLIYGKVNCDAKVSKSIIWVNKKNSPTVPIAALGKNSRNEKYIHTSIAN
jgi:hypothetical protein